MVILTPSAYNAPIIGIPTDVGPDPIKIKSLKKTFSSPEKAFDAIREQSIQVQLDAIKDLGRSSKQGDKMAKELLEDIADNDDDKKQFVKSVQTSAQTILKNIETSDDDDEDGDSNDGKDDGDK